MTMRDHRGPTENRTVTRKRLRDRSLSSELIDLAEVVTLIEAEPLRLILGRPGARDRDARDRSGEQLEVVDVCSGDLEADRHALPSQSKLRFVPRLALSVGFGPLFSPPSGAFVIAPSADNHSQSSPLMPSYSISPCRQNSRKTPAAVHSRKRR